MTVLKGASLRLLLVSGLAVVLLGTGVGVALGQIAGDTTESRDRGPGSTGPQRPSDDPQRGQDLDTPDPGDDGQDTDRGPAAPDGLQAPDDADARPSTPGDDTNSLRGQLSDEQPPVEDLPEDIAPEDDSLDQPDDASFV